MRKPNGLEYLVIDFQDISIVGGGDNLSFAFRRISVTYTPQRADGTGGAAVSFSWDVAANREIF